MLAPSSSWNIGVLRRGGEGTRSVLLGPSAVWTVRTGDCDKSILVWTLSQKEGA